MLINTSFIHQTLMEYLFEMMCGFTKIVTQSSLASPVSIDTDCPKLQITKTHPPGKGTLVKIFNHSVN